MTTRVVFATPNQGYQDERGDLAGAHRVRRARRAVLRREIDAAAAAEPGRYFEYHLKVVVPPGELEPVRAAAEAHGARLSRNARLTRRGRARARRARDRECAGSGDDAGRRVDRGDLSGDRLTRTARIVTTDTRVTNDARFQIDLAVGDPMCVPPRRIAVAGVGDVLACAPETLFGWKLHGLCEFGPGRWRAKDLFDLDLL